MHAVGMQLTDMTHGVLPKPAHHLRESDSQAPLGLGVTGFTWLAIRCASYQAAPLPACHFPFQVNMLKGSWTGEQARGVTAES